MRQASRALATFDDRTVGFMTKSLAIPIAAAMAVDCTAGVARDRDAIVLNPDLQCRFVVTARGATAAPLVITSPGEIEACRCFGRDVDDADSALKTRDAIFRWKASHACCAQEALL